MFERRDSSGNAALTSLFSTVSGSDPSMTILDSSGWPTGGANGPFFGVCEDEVIKFDSRNGTLLTVSSNGRGWDGTAAGTHQAGAVISHDFVRTDGDEANYAVSKTVGNITQSQSLLVSDAVHSFTELPIGAGLLQNIGGALTYGLLQADAVSDPSMITDGIIGPAELSTDVAGDGLTGGNGVALSVAAGTGLEISADTVRIAAAAAGAGLVGGGGSALALSVDDITLELNGDILRVKGNSIGTTQLDDTQQIPVGSMMPFAGSSAPTGWFFTYGQEVSRTDQVNLFNVIGTTYGVGDGSTTFNLPDTRGRVAVTIDNLGGSDAGRLTAANTLGTTGGEELHTITTAEMPAHTHTDNGHVHQQNTGFVNAGIGARGTGGGEFTASNTGTGFASLANTGGGGSHNNMQPFILVSYIIKL